MFIVRTAATPLRWQRYFKHGPGITSGDERQLTAVAAHKSRAEVKPSPTLPAFAESSNDLNRFSPARADKPLINLRKGSIWPGPIAQTIARLDRIDCKYSQRQVYLRGFSWSDQARDLNLR